MVFLTSKKNTLIFILIHRHSDLLNITEFQTPFSYINQTGQLFVAFFVDSTTNPANSFFTVTVFLLEYN